MKTATAFVLGTCQAVAQSFVSCNNDDAHFQNMAVSISPDPPILGGMTTMVIEGDVDKAISGGSATIQVSAGIIKIPSMTIPFSSNLQGPITHVKATLGPFKYPNINVPLLNTVKMDIEVKDQDGEQVMCMHSSLPALGKDEPELETVPFTNCADETTSHVKNFHIETDPVEPSKGDTITITSGGDLDEEVSSGNMDLSVDVSLFKLNMAIPFAIEPSISAITGGELTIGPMKLIDIPLMPNAKGSAKLTEQNGEPLACLNFNVPLMGEVSV